ncbi:MAG TPA: VTT domain-containing protein [Methanobacterium sp.]|nr:VTT domain-containing protein [Methanobacterium sp.]
MLNKINLETQMRFRLILLAAVIIILLLIPFILFGDSLESWTDNFIQSTPTKLIASIVIGFLLSIDIVTPVPSSIVSTAGGYFLGFIGGTLISLAGMTISCLIGYWIGAKLGRPAAERFVDTKEISIFESLQKKYGDWIIIISRSIPVLAETSVLFAGIGRMKISRFIFMVSISNLGISMVYAAVGAYSAHINSFLFAFAAAILFPGVMILILRNRKIVNF